VEFDGCRSRGRLWQIVIMESLAFNPLNISPQENHRKGHNIRERKKSRI
jgi:hypothetical protein